MQLPTLLTIDEVAEHLRVPKATLYAWNYKGTGPLCFKVGRFLRYDQADLEAWVKTQKFGS